MSWSRCLIRNRALPTTAVASRAAHHTLDQGGYHVLDNVVYSCYKVSVLETRPYPERSPEAMLIRFHLP